MNILSIDDIVLNIIILAYPIELFTVVHDEHVLGFFSPYRLIIFPLCIFYLLKSKNRFPQNISELVAISLFFISGLIGTLSSTFTAFFSFVGNIIQFLMAYNFVKNRVIGNSTLMVFTFLVVMQIPSLYFFITAGSSGITNRFTGLFFDPNYLSAFILSAIWAAFFLYGKMKNKWIRLYCVLVIISGVVMIFYSLSRGGILSLFFSLLVYLIVNNKKIGIIAISLMVPLISTLMVRAQFLTWYDAEASSVDGIIYRLFTVSDDMDALTAGRSSFIMIFIENVKDYLIIGTDIYKYMNTYNSGYYIHNGLIEIMVQGGVVFGGVFIIRYVYAIIKCMLYEQKYHSIPSIWLIALCTLVSLTFLSYNSKYAWFCMGIIFAFSDLKAFKLQYLSNHK